VSEVHEPEPETDRDGREAKPGPPYSPLAIAALAATLLGILLGALALAYRNPLPAYAGLALFAGSLMLAFAAAVHIRSRPGRYRGRPLAVTAAALTGIVLVTVLGIAVYGAFFGSLGPHWVLQSRSDLRQLSTAVMNYTTDHDGQFPRAASWLEVLGSERYLDPRQELGRDHRDPNAGRMFAMNAALGGYHSEQISEPGRTVLFFECRPGAPLAGGPDLLPDEPRYDGKYLVAFVDGHTERVPPAEIGDLVWEPEGPAPNR
jgi:hypothetical protein